MVELPPLDLHGQIKKALEKMEPQMSVITDIMDERRRQDAQWGVQNHHPAYWLAIVGKQVGQLGTAILDREWWTDQAAGTAKVRAEAVQGAAVLMALIECIDRGEMPIGLDTMPQGRQRAHALGVGDEVLDYEGNNECPTDGCSGDARYAAPGRGHMDGCTYPHPQQYVKEGKS